MKISNPVGNSTWYISDDDGTPLLEIESQSLTHKTIQKEIIQKASIENIKGNERLNRMEDTIDLLLLKQEGIL